MALMIMPDFKFKNAQYASPPARGIISSAGRRAEIQQLSTATDPGWVSSSFFGECSLAPRFPGGVIMRAALSGSLKWLCGFGNRWTVAELLGPQNHARSGACSRASSMCACCGFSARHALVV